MSITGLQVPGVRLPIKAGSTETYLHALFCSRQKTIYPDGQGREGDPDEGKEADERDAGVLEKERKGRERCTEEGAEGGSRSGQNRGGEEGGGQASEEARVPDQPDRVVQSLRRKQAEECAQTLRFLLKMADNPLASEIEGEDASIEAPAGAHLEDVDPDTLRDVDFDDGKPLFSYDL